MAIDYDPANCVVSVNVSDYERSKAWDRDVLGFAVVYELGDYGWCELSTPFGFTVGLGQSGPVTPGSIVPGPQARARLMQLQSYAFVLLRRGPSATGVRSGRGCLSLLHASMS